MQYAKLFAGALLATAAAFTTAAPAPAPPVGESYSIDLDETSSFGFEYKGAGYTGKSFLDIYNFSVASSSDFDTVLTSIATKTVYDLNITSFDLYRNTAMDTVLVATGLRLLTGKTDVWTLSDLNLSNGSYSLQVGGTFLGTSGGSYVGNVNISPVPEPEAWSMVGIGLAAVGFMARRRGSGALSA